MRDDKAPPRVGYCLDISHPAMMEPHARHYPRGQLPLKPHVNLFVEFDDGTYIWGTLRDQHRPEGGDPPIPRAPIGIEEREDFRAALSDGEGFILKINRPFSCLRFGPDVFNSVAEIEFLLDLINVLHLVLSRHDIMVDAAEILRSGIECTGIQLDPNMQWIYLVNVNFPTQHGSIKFACACRTIGRGMRTR